MKTKTFILCVIVLIAYVGNAESKEDFIDLREQVKRLRLELARQGAYAFVTNRETTPAIAPRIHSQYWVDGLPKANIEQIAYEQEKRDFGLDFVGELEKLALLDIPLDDIDALERHAGQLLTIAEWLKTERGYGNQILKKWSEHIAMSSAGGMAVNPGCMTNRVFGLISRVDTLQNDAARRVDILNEESPHRYSLPKCQSVGEVERLLEAQWMPHLAEACNYFSGETGRSCFTFSDAPNAPRQFSFYLYDPGNSESPAIRSWWGDKRHEGVCVYGMYAPLKDDVLAILKIREAIGEIPAPTQQEISDDHLAFLYTSRLQDAWRAKTKTEELLKGGMSIVAIYGRTFVDWHTRALRRERGWETRIHTLSSDIIDAAKQ